MKTENRDVPKRLIELDGLRGAAILFVVMWHYFYFFPTPDHQSSGLLRNVYVYCERCIATGWTGVDLFFVLSGFLIGGILLDAKSSPSYFRTFYIRRFFRIVPIYYTWISLYILWEASLALWLRPYANTHEELTAWQIIAHFLFIQNLGFVRYSGMGGAWFVSTWSLAVEEQFYLLAPVVIWCLPKRKLITVLIASVMAAPLLRLCIRGHSFGIHFNAISHLDPVYVLMPCRVDALACGMLGAICWRNPTVRAWIIGHGRILYSLVAVAFGGVVILTYYSPDQHSMAMQSIGYTWIALFYVLILLLALSDSAGPVASLARMSWLRELGGVSYCMYLIHQVMNGLCHMLLGSGNLAAWKTVAAPVFAFALTYGIAKMSWKYLGKPLLDRGHKYRYSSVPATTLIVGQYH